MVKRNTPPEHGVYKARICVRLAVDVESSLVLLLLCLSLLQARDMIVSECDQVKEICDTLASFKSNPRPSAYNSYDNQEIGSPFGDYARNDYSRHEEPTRDPDVWPPPTPVEHR